MVFVSSRRQTRLTAMDLIAYAAADERRDGFVHMSSDELASHVARTKDAALRHCLRLAWGCTTLGYRWRTAPSCEQLFAECKIQVLVCTSTLAWGVNLPAHLVVIKGTEFYDGKTRRYVDFPITDALQMMGRAGRPQFDKSGVCVIMCHEPKKAFYKKFLYEPFPVESSLAEALPDHFNAEIVAGTIASKQDAVDFLSWTYFFRRLVKNPSYYDLESVEHEALNAFLSSLVENALAQLEDARCVATSEDDGVEPLLLGRVASYYYLKHASVALFAANLGPENSVEELLGTLCGVAEYDELPVRHNEDKVNAELARRVEAAGGYAVDARLADDPHTKANLLFQAHFLRLAAHVGLRHGRQGSDRPVRAHPPGDDRRRGGRGVARDRVRRHEPHADGDAGTRHARAAVVPCPASTLTARRSSPGGASRRSAPRAPRADGPGTREGRLTRGGVARRRDGRDRRARREASSRGRRGDPRQPRRRAGGEDACVEVSLRRFKPGKGSGAGGRGSGGRGSAPRAVCPRYPKLKEEGWWLVLGDRTSRELLALRRVSFGDKTATTLTYEPAPPGAPEDLVVYLMSDCYLGMDQEVEISAAGRVEFHGAHGEGERGRRAREKKPCAWRGRGRYPRQGAGRDRRRRRLRPRRSTSTSRTETGFGWTRRAWRRPRRRGNRTRRRTKPRRTTTTTISGRHPTAIRSSGRTKTAHLERAA